MKALSLIALLGCALALPVAAQADNLYVGASLGGARGRIDSNGNQSSATNTGFTLYGGYQFNPTFGAEAGYAYLGNADASYNGVDGAHIKPHALYAAATATLPLSTDFALFAKAGVAFNHTRFEMPGGNQTLDNGNTTPMFGVGARFNITPAMALVAEYDNYGKVQREDFAHIKADMISFGLRYAF